MSQRAYDAAAAVEEACETVVDLLRDGFGAIRCLDAMAQREQPPDTVWNLLSALYALQRRVANMDREFEFDGMPDPLTPEPALALTELRARVRHALYAIETDPAMEDRQTDTAMLRAANYVRAALGEQHDDPLPELEVIRRANERAIAAETKWVASEVIADIRAAECDIYRKRAAEAEEERDRLRRELEAWAADIAPHPFYWTEELGEIRARLDWILKDKS